MGVTFYWMSVFVSKKEGVLGWDVKFEISTEKSCTSHSFTHKQSFARSKHGIMPFIMSYNIGIFTFAKIFILWELESCESMCGCGK